MSKNKQLQERGSQLFCFLKPPVASGKKGTSSRKSLFVVRTQGNNKGGPLSNIKPHLNSETDVTKHLKVASVAIGALKWGFRNRNLDYRAKWPCLRGPSPWHPFLQLGGMEPAQGLYHRLRRFHNRCAHTMCRIAIAHIIRRLITTKSLFTKQLDTDPPTPTSTVAFFGGPATFRACPCLGFRAHS